MKYKIEFTEEQIVWLRNRLQIDFDEELNYQASNSEQNTDYLEMELSIYEKLLYSMDKYLYQKRVSKEIVDSMNKEIKQLKGE